MGFNYICFAFFISLVFASEFCIGFKYDSSPHPWKLGGTVIGIDFGTTYSRAGVYNNGKVEIISNIPSFVAFTDTGVRLIGEAAKNQTALNPERTIFNVKRLLGRMFDDPEVQKDLKMLPYKVVNKDGEPYIEVKIRDGETTRTEVFSPEEISAMIIENIKEMAEYYLGKTIHNAVVTIPAYFNDAERQATHDAYALAGLNVVRIINEATAAAIAYGLHERAGDPKNILVIDLGGGTLDASVLNIDEGVIEFLSSSSSSSQTIDDLFRRIVGPALKDANLEWSDVDEILVVGECTRIANVKEVLIRGGDYLGGKELLSNGSVNPDEAVAYGAAVQGWILSGLPYFVSTKLSLGIETAGGVMTTLIPIYTTMPTKMSQVFSTCKHNQTTLSIKIYDGERAFTRDCRQLGSFELSGIPPAPRGVPDIEVVFEMDENYILKVTAQDKELKSSITLDVRPRITKDKIQEKIRDAEEFAEEDRKAKEKIEARNNKLMTIKEMIDEQDTVVLDDGNHPIVKKKKKKKKNKGGRRCCRPQSSDIAKDEL